MRRTRVFPLLGLCRRSRGVWGTQFIPWLVASAIALRDIPSAAISGLRGINKGGSCAAVALVTVSRSGVRGWAAFSRRRRPRRGTNGVFAFRLIHTRTHRVSLPLKRARDGRLPDLALSNYSVGLPSPFGCLFPEFLTRPIALGGTCGRHEVDSDVRQRNGLGDLVPQRCFVHPSSTTDPREFLEGGAALEQLLEISKGWESRVEKRDAPETSHGTAGVRQGSRLVEADRW